MLKKFLLNLIGNEEKGKYKFSLNKQLLLLISLITIFTPFFFVKLIWPELETPENKKDFLIAIFTYYGTISGILVGAYSYNKGKNGQDS